MNTPRRIRTVVISVPAESDWLASDRPRMSSRLKPSNLVPWSDPTIAGLVEKLQQEVRDERSRMTEMEMSWIDSDTDDGIDGFSIDTDTLLNR